MSFGIEGSQSVAPFVQAGTGRRGRVLVELSGTPKLDLKLPDRCEGAVGSVALRVRPTAIDAGLRAAVEPLVQVGTKVGPNPELASCRSRLRDAESKVQRERSALNSARNASSQARATRVAALRSAEEDVVRTRKRCSSMPSTAKVPVMESKSYPTKTQILEVELKVTLTLQPTGGKPLKASGTIRPRVLSVRHAAHPALGVRAMNAAPPTEAELRERVYSDLDEHVGKLVAKGIRRSARSLRAEVEQARDGACMPTQRRRCGCCALRPRSSRRCARTRRV